MSKKVLIVQNSTHEGPALIEDVLRERGISLEIVDLAKGEPLPLPHSFDAVIILGGPDSANDETEKMKSERAFIAAVLAAKIPYLGICLGLQTLVKVAGGSVMKSPVREIGFRGPDESLFTVELTAVGKSDPLFVGLADSLRVFQLHGETVALTQEMQLLATGKFCTNQVVKIGENAYGVQCHFELTPEKFESWLVHDPDLTTMKKDALRADFEAGNKQYEAVGRTLFTNFLKIAGF